MGSRRRRRREGLAGTGLRPAPRHVLRDRNDDLALLGAGLPLPGGPFQLLAGVFDRNGRPLRPWQPVCGFDVVGPALDPVPPAVLRQVPVYVDASWDVARRPGRALTSWPSAGIDHDVRGRNRSAGIARDYDFERPLPAGVPRLAPSEYATLVRRAQLHGVEACVYLSLRFEDALRGAARDKLEASYHAALETHMRAAHDLGIAAACSTTPASCGRRSRARCSPSTSTDDLTCGRTPISTCSSRRAACASRSKRSSREVARCSTATGG